MKATRATLIAALTGLSVAAAAQSYPGGWSGPYVGPTPPPGPDYGPRYGVRDPREGKIDASTFVANSPAVGKLGHGPIVLTDGATGIGNGPDDGAYETALVDQLAKAGYLTNAKPNAGGQTVEFIVHHDVIQPPDPPHNPVRGGVSVDAGSHGWGGVGVGLEIDLSKPLKALLATRLEARIRDSATRELLWQGRAQVITREGDKHWTEQTIAVRLAAALFKDFPKPFSS